ncbi:telomerase reverse transcriptase [Micractinium conductrix]|uniref:Telomerase reverse transcriptase n=1 Tax=Micractinium conductrix TaxID=554055 RepID=A0A2P6VHE1_9CHLO|nr:telomerase reverse transcriptase [Micractinium conductrix]|eukprot:PSC73504.1 telomerase reverse transcriptase [Micractinium conductrix]
MRAQRRAPRPGGPPPLLTRLYGEGEVLSLRQLLLRLSALSREAAPLPTALVQPHDHADFSQALLERTWCVLRSGSPPLRDGFSLSQASGQHQLVGRAVEALLRSGHQKSSVGGGNVLCYGFRKRRNAAGARSVPGMTTAEALHHNSTTATLCSPAWQLLLSRVGDTLMLYLLLHTSLFAELPNACCLQLSGPPISQVARAWRKQAPAAVAAAATRLLAGAAAGAASIFYCASFSRKPGLTSQHVLVKLRGAPEGERTLFAAIFDPKHSPVGRAGSSYAAVQSTVPPRPRRVPARHRHLLPLLRRLLDRAAKCPFAILLQHHCPLPPQLREVQQRHRREQQQQAAGKFAAGNGAAQPASLASCFVPHRRVAAFVWGVVRAIVPAALLGDCHNQRVLRAAIGRFVRLRRYEQMTVHQAMQGLRTSGFPWLRPGNADVQQAQQQQQQQQQRRRRQQPPPPLRQCATAAAAAQRALALWVGWLFAVLVAPLLRAHFYCTESEAYRQQVFYYRKPVWAALARDATEELQQRQFAPLAARQAQAILQARKLGVARLRLLPKRAGMRAILNLGCASTVRFPGARQPAGTGAKRGRRAPAVKLTFRPVNSLLQNVYQVLRHEASTQPHLLGASVFGYNDAYCKLRPWLRKWRAAAEAAAAGGDTLRPLIVSVDVTRAFDSVSIPLLLSLVEPLLRHDSYLVLKYSEVVPSLGAVKVLHRRLAAAEGPEGPPAFPVLATRWAGAHKGKTYTDQVLYDRVTRQQALATLREHLTANLVRLRRRWCAQACGIAQGSTLSTLLCSLYLAHLERAEVEHILSGQLPPPSAGLGVPRGAAGGGGGGDSVICLTGGNAAVLSPAAVISVGGFGAAGVASSGSKGLLTELARAADSWASGQPCDGGGGAGGSLAAAARGSEGTGQVGSERSRQRRGARSGGGAGGAAGQPTGDLLLLPAGAAPAAGAAGAAAAASAGGVAAGPSTSPSLLSPALSGAPAGAGVQPLGCSRLALHAGSLLLRLVDDYLLITAVPAVAQGFACRMLQGFESHNVFVNSDKTKLSFALQLAGEAGSSGGGRGGRGGAVVPAAVWRSADGATFIKWCGLLINTATLELQGDYTRYAGEHLSSTLTLPLRKQPGAQLATRLCQYLRPKIHPLLLDAGINSAPTVRLNIYQAFLLGAMKFHCYVRALPAAPAPATAVLLDAVLTGIAFMKNLTRRRRVASAHQAGLQTACSTRVPAAHIRWLGLTAFQIALRRKQARYGELLAALDELAAVPALRRAARQLAPVVAPARNSVFEGILY